ncbi:MAG: DNA polymerase III subunit delta [Candidatus Omnitrophica bacterium]|nr:DNA polymerase III subunit delta [Candidatus Omnitrophota bacterium]
MVILKDSPVYLLAGSENYLKEKSLTRLKANFLNPESADFNFNVFYAASSSAEQILECARTVPFLGTKRIVLVHGAEDLSPVDRKSILAYLLHPQEHTCLILETAEADLVDSFFSEISKKARVIYCQAMQEDKLKAWVADYLKQKGKQIATTAQRMLLENLGNDLQSLANALDTLTLYVGAKEVIESADVEKLIGPDLSTNAFELFKAVSSRNKNKALRILHALLQEGVNSSQILGALTHQLNSGRAYLPIEILRRAFQGLQRTDADIKTGRLSQNIALELLLVKLLDLFQLTH